MEDGYDQDREDWSEFHVDLKRLRVEEPAAQTPSS
jgi:hypothetical protein